LFMYYSIGQ